MARIESKEQLAALVADSRSFGEVARKLDYKTVKEGKLPGGVYKYLQGKVKDWGIDVSHFPGRGWAKGKTRLSDAGIDKQARNVECPWDEAFRVGSRVRNRILMRRLIASGKRTYHCGECGLNEWRDKPLRLELHHLNGINDDNREENLQIICPNCHSQTSSHSRGANADVSELADDQE